MTQCEEAHILCLDCARQGARTAFENLNAALPCLAVGDCDACYPPEEARKFLNDPVQRARWEQLRRDSDVAVLAGENLRRCPFCP